MSCQATITITNLNKFSREELPEVIADELEAVARRLRLGQGSVRITKELFDDIEEGPMTIVSVPYVTADEVPA